MQVRTRDNRGCEGVQTRERRFRCEQCEVSVAPLSLDQQYCRLNKSRRERYRCLVGGEGSIKRRVLSRVEVVMTDSRRNRKGLRNELSGHRSITCCSRMPRSRSRAARNVTQEMSLTVAATEKLTNIEYFALARLSGSEHPRLDDFSRNTEEKPTNLMERREWDSNPR